MRVPQFFRIDAGHRTEGRPLAFSFTPQIRFVWEYLFAASCNRSLSLRPSGLLATLADRTGWTLCSSQPTMASYIPARWTRITPGPVGYATAPN